MPQPFSQQNLNRLLILLIVVLALVAGYYQSVMELQIRKYDRLQIKYQQLEQQLKDRQR